MYTMPLTTLLPGCVRIFDGQLLSSARVIVVLSIGCYCGGQVMATDAWPGSFNLLFTLIVLVFVLFAYCCCLYK